MRSESDAPSTLSWGLKASFRSYLREVSDSGWEVDGGATLTAEAVHFPQTERPLQFGGKVVIRAHRGMMRIHISMPAIEKDERAGELLTADIGGRRVPVCTLEAEPHPAQGLLLSYTATLHPEGVAVFDDVYQPGTVMDPIFVINSPPAARPDRSASRAEQTSCSRSSPNTSSWAFSPC